MDKNHGGFRERAGRKAIDGEKHVYKVAPEVHDYIKAHGGGRWITQIVRAIAANEKL